MLFWSRLEIFVSSAWLWFSFMNLPSLVTEFNLFLFLLRGLNLLYGLTVVVVLLINGLEDVKLVVETSNFLVVVGGFCVVVFFIGCFVVVEDVLGVNFLVVLHLLVVVGGFFVVVVVVVEVEEIEEDGGSSVVVVGGFGEEEEEEVEVVEMDFLFVHRFNFHREDLNKD